MAHSFPVPLTASLQEVGGQQEQVRHFFKGGEGNKNKNLKRCLTCSCCPCLLKRCLTCSCCPCLLKRCLTCSCCPCLLKRCLTCSCCPCLLNRCLTGMRFFHQLAYFRLFQAKCIILEISEDMIIKLYWVGSYHLDVVTNPRSQLTFFNANVALFTVSF